MGHVVADAPKGLILNARLLWSFSALFRATGDPQDRCLADRARAYLNDRFRDPNRGGYYWQLDAAGRATDPLKRTYGQAFCIYALCESHLAFRRPEDRNAAIDLFELIERHTHDTAHGGYFEVCRADWSVADGERLSEKDQPAAKSMNTHLHLLEAYTNLYRTWPDARVAEAIRELLDVFGRHILTPDRRHLRPFFAQNWRAQSASYTYGHDIEAAWLLREAAKVLEDPQLVETTDSWAVTIATAVLEEALDQDDGLIYEGRDGQVVDRGRQWWPQAEAVVGFLDAYCITRQPTFLQAADRVWQFIRRRFVDREHGEWHWQLGPDGRFDPAQPKVSAWKGPYHNVRMCLEALRRIESLNDELPAAIQEKSDS